MQSDTCPTEWYIANGHSANLRMRLTSSDWLKVVLWIHSPVTTDTSYSERLLFVGLSLCDVSDATGPCIQKSTINQSEFVWRMRKFVEWPLGMYPSARHSIALHSVLSFIIWSTSWQNLPPRLGVQVSLKRTCSSIEANWKSWNLEYSMYVLRNEWWRRWSDSGCPDWSETSLGAHSLRGCCHPPAQKLH